MAELLKARGYHTVHIGKWHTGTGPEFGPNAQGFDEALLMADRVIPLLPGHGKGASLAPEITVPLERPRDRRGINHNEHFQVLRRQLINTLLDSKKQAGGPLIQRVSLPDILPEDIMNINTVKDIGRKGPRRRSDLHKEEVEIATS